MTELVRRRLCLAVDAEKYGSQDDQRQHAIQKGLHAVLDLAAHRCGLDRSRWDRQPQGDGEFAILPDDQPETVVVDDFVRELARALTRHNRDLKPEARLRLRLAAHVGVAVPDCNGYSGQGAVVVHRIRDCEPLRRALTDITDTDLVVALSDRIYQDIVQHGHTALAPEDMRPIAVQEKEFSEHAWLYVPILRATPPTPAAPPARPETCVVNRFYAPVHANFANFGVLR